MGRQGESFSHSPHLSFPRSSDPTRTSRRAPTRAARVRVARRAESASPSARGAAHRVSISATDERVVKLRRGGKRFAIGRKDVTPAPERNPIFHSDAIAENHKRRQNGRVGSQEIFHRIRVG